MTSRCRTAVRPSPTFLGPGAGDPGVGPVAPELVMNLIITVNARATKGVGPQIPLGSTLIRSSSKSPRTDRYPNGEPTVDVAHNHMAMSPSRLTPNAGSW